VQNVAVDIADHAAVSYCAVSLLHCLNWLAVLQQRCRSSAGVVLWPGSMLDDIRWPRGSVTWFKP
jgi:hypothetical protein